MFISSAVAQAPAAGATPDAGFLGSPLVLMIVMFVAMYFMIFRPQMNRAKVQKAMIDALQKGDEVITVGGVLGKITKVSDAYITLEIAPNIEVSVQKAAVQTLLPKGTIKSVQ